MSCTMDLYDRWNDIMDSVTPEVRMANLERPPSPVLALRESFGDRKLPDITRKITACVACRKQKVLPLMK